MVEIARGQNVYEFSILAKVFFFENYQILCCWNLQGLDVLDEVASR